MEKFLSTKFILSLIALIFAGAAFLMRIVTGQEFFVFAGTILAVYQTADVVQTNNTEKNYTAANNTPPNVPS